VRNGVLLSRAALSLVGVLAVGYAGQGGFHAPVQLVIGGLLATGVVASWHAGRTDPGVIGRTLGWPGAALCAWIAVSAAANGPARSAAGAIALVLAIASIRAIAAGLDAEEGDALTVTLIALGCVVALTGWVGLVGVVGDAAPWVHTAGVRRASTSLTYPNAAAAVLVPLALVAACRAAVVRSAGAHAGVCVLVMGLGATLSRGGALAFAVGLVVLCSLRGARFVVRGAGPGFVGAGIALAGLLPAFTEVPVTPWEPAVAGLALGLGIAAAAGLARRGETVVLGVAGLGVAAATWAAASGAARFPTGGERGSLSSPERRASIAAALDVGRDHPLFGTGPGRALASWRGPHGEVLASRFAHNEYAQTFAELGAVGLALVLALIAKATVDLWRSRGQTPSPDHPAGDGADAAAALAAVAAFGTHSLVDFLWHIPAIPLTVAAIAGLALAGTDPNHRRTRRRTS
jgi:hypothetical protein